MSQIKTFFVGSGDAAAEEEANAFLRGHRVLRVDRAWAGDGWAMLVEWLDGASGDGARGAASGGRWGERKVDYRAVLDAETFERFARLLELRAEAVTFARESLGLDFKTPPALLRTGRGMTFLGMRVFPGGIRLSRPSKTRWRRRVRALEAEAAAGLLPDDVLQARVTSMTAWTDSARPRSWRNHAQHDLSAHREERSASGASCAAAPGTTTPGTAAPRTAIGTRPATATTTSASAPSAPQHRPLHVFGLSPR